MEGFLLVVLLVVLFVRWLVLSSRMSELRRKIDELESRPSDPRLIQRVYKLEKEIEELSRVRSSAAAEKPVTEPVIELVTPPAPIVPPLPEAVMAEIARQPVIERPSSVPASEPEPQPVHEAPPDISLPVAAMAATTSPSLADRLREKMSGEEWEAIVGGSWLNKLGVFVLVIGIALFLGYSFTTMGPPGRVAIGLAVSLAMLAGGIFLERRARYTNFARGLLGGGWGALYFTSYAMHAIDAARVIDNSLAGLLLLLAVATGMIVHSLRYRSQTVTGLAYFLAFATLSPAVTPVAALSVVALIPLAASLLYIANRFQWSQLALMGLIATYGTCASRGDSGAALWQAQTVFTTYWLLFEVFDLLRARRRTEYTPSEQPVFWLNAVGFTLLSYAKWSAAAPQHLFALAGAVAALYLASAVLRAVLRPPSSFPAETLTTERALSGGYEGPITLTALLTLAAIFLKFHGPVAEVGLLAEAELFFLAGLYFREAYPRQVAIALFAGGALKLLFNDVPAGGQARVGRWQIYSWTPVAALGGLLFYVNRTLRSADWFYGYAGSAALALILGFEAPQRYVGSAWLGLAAVLFALGWLRRLKDFRIQGYIVAALGLCGVAVHQANVAMGAAARVPNAWIGLACAALISYAGVLCALRSAPDRLEEWERLEMRRIGSWSATAALVVLAWRLLPGDYLGLGWLAVALLLLEFGLRAWPADFRTQSYAVAALGAARVLLFNLIPVENTGPLTPRITIAGAALLAYAFAIRIYRAPIETARERERSAVFNASSAAGTLFLLAAIWALLPPVVIGPAWAGAGLLIVELGFALDVSFLRLQGHIVSASALGRLFFANFTGLGSTGFVSHRILTVVPVIASQYYQWSRQKLGIAQLKEWERSFGRLYLYAAAVAGVVLMRFELGRVFTVTGWAAFALALLILGDRWNNTDFRWQSYILSALCFWRSWTTNFYAPESFAGVSGRILTGAFVIACFYAAHMLTPRPESEDTRIERHARLFFSMLASVLLAVLLFYEVSGSVLTVAWGAEGIALLAAGFPLNDRVFRLSGLTLFLVCVLKLFLYDLRHLETLYRILSFIVLGLMLVSVSWVYTRFRDRIQRYL